MKRVATVALVKAEPPQLGLSIAEATRLKELETAVQQGEAAYVKAGLALREIRDGKLYRAEFKTFEEYAKARWGYVRRTAYERIAASAAAENVRSSAQIDLSFTQARTLAPLAPEQQRALASRVDFENITVRELREKVKKLTPPKVVTLVPDEVTETPAPELTREQKREYTMKTHRIILVNNALTMLECEPVIKEVAAYATKDDYKVMARLLRLISEFTKGELSS